MRALALILVVGSLAVLAAPSPAPAQDKNTVKDLNDALKAIQSTDPVNRTAGMYFLAQYGKDSKAYSKQIVTGLLDANADVRMWAAKGLPLANPELAGPVLTLVQNPDYDKRKDALQQLAKMGDAGGPAVPALLAFLKDVRPTDKAEVVKTLVTVGTKDTALPDVLTKMAVNDADPAVRKAALAGLPKMENRQAVANAFGEFLKDTNPAQRASAITALGDLAKDNPHIVTVLRQALSKDPSPTVKAAAQQALAKLKMKK